MSIIRSIKIWWSYFKRTHWVVLFSGVLAHCDCRKRRHWVENPLMDHCAVVGTHSVAVAKLSLHDRRGQWCRRTTKNSDQGWELDLLRKRERCAFMVAGWICARRASAGMQMSTAGAGRLLDTRAGCREDLAVSAHARTAHPIGDAMSMHATTDDTRLTQLLGVSLLLMPSSAGDNRPYISNLAGKLADACSFVGGAP